MGDYKKRCITDLRDGTQTPIDLPKSDVLRFELENGDVTIVRPSGTEPKIKIYFLASALNKTALDEQVEKYISTSDELLCD